MNITHDDAGRRVNLERESGMTTAIGGSGIEALAGAGSVVVSILALAGLLVVPFASIAAIAAGAALLVEAATVSAQEARSYRETDEARRVFVRGGIGADAIGGIGAIVLGVLALIGISPATLLPAAAIVLGGGLLLSAGAPLVEPSGVRLVRATDLTRESVTAASGVHALVGAGSVVLGILGVLGEDPIVLSLVAMLSIGAAQLLSGAALGGRMLRMFQHRA